MSAIPAVFGMLLAFVAGLSFVVQQAVNAQLRVEIESAWWAGFVSYVGGTVTMAVMAILLREPLPSANLIVKSHAMSWTGGLFGAVYIAISILLLSKMGAAAVIAFIVAGQLIGSMVFDHFGIFDMPIHPLSMKRLVGTGMLVFGALLVRQ